MSAVIDASVLVAATIDAGPHGVWAEQVLAREPLFAPELIYVEATNVLRRLECAKKISMLEATAAHEDHLQLSIEACPFIPFWERVWALRHSLTSYDAWYVAVAEALELPLATLDTRLARADGPRCKFLLPGVTR